MVLKMKSPEDRESASEDRDAKPEKWSVATRLEAIAGLKRHIKDLEGQIREHVAELSKDEGLMSVIGELVAERERASASPSASPSPSPSTEERFNTMFNEPSGPQGAQFERFTAWHARQPVGLEFRPMEAANACDINRNSIGAFLRNERVKGVLVEPTGRKTWRILGVGGDNAE